MTDDTLFLNGGEPVDEVLLEDQLTDMDVAADGDDDDMVFDEALVAEEPEDNDFKLDGYDDLGIVEENDEDEDDEKPQDSDPEYDHNVTGQKRKRVQSVPNASVLQPSAVRTQADNTEAFILDEDTGFDTKPSSRVPGTFGRRNRKKGDTLPAYHKRVSHELDSDDEMMMEMRDKGFSDRQIADKLAKEGRVRYDQKSISTRIMRIRLAQADNVDFLLKEGYKEWEFEDDCILMQAYALADIEVNYEIERIRAWRYRKVSEYMRRLNKDALFSATACRERYNALIDGTARIPTDMDDDPDTRRLELEKYRQSREDARIKNQEEKDAKEAIERKAKDEARSRHAQKAEETAYKRHKENEKKAQRAMDRAAAAQARSQRSEENITAKRQRNLQIKKQKTADANRAAKGKGKATVTTKPAQPAPNPNNTLTVPNDKITADTPDPRSYLSVRDLTKMCADRGIPALGKSQDQLLGDLQDADGEWSLNDLKKMCRSKGLNAAGSKLQIKYQLAFAAAQVCQSFCAGVDAAKDAGGETVMKEDE